MPARSYLLVDAEDGDVLAARAAGRESPIASTTKLMTAFVARRSLELDQGVVAPAYQAASAESLLGLDAGERIEVRDLLYGMLLASGNDAAVALAEASAGSVPRFVARMNREAERLGLEDTSYANPIGLDAPGNYSTARDLVALALELREDPFLRRVFDTPTYATTSGARSRTVTNRNTLVRTVPWVDGVKTGYTLGAGYVLVGSGERDGVEVLAAVLGAPSESARDAATLDLLEHGISLYRRRTAFEARERLATATVEAQDLELPLIAAGAGRATLREDERLETVLSFPAQVEGPIRRDTPLGRAELTVDGEPVAEVALLAGRSIPEASRLERLDAAVPGPRALVWMAAFLVVAALLAVAIAVSDRVRAGRRRAG